LDNVALKPVSCFNDIAKRVHLHLGIIAVPPEKAQEAAVLMVGAGILAIWNVSGVPVETPPRVIVADEVFGADEDIENNQAIALSLLALNRQLKTKMGWERY